MIWHVLAWAIEGIGTAAVVSIVIIWLGHRVQRHRETMETIRRARRISMERERNIRASADRLIDEAEGYLRYLAGDRTMRQDETEGGEDW